MATERTLGPHERRGLHLALTIVALVVAVYITLQIIGVLVKLVFLALAVVVAVAAYRAWRDSDSP